MADKKLLVCYIEEKGCEITTPVLLSLLENVETFGDSVQNAKFPTSLKNVLFQYPGLTHVILIGTYWNDSLKFAQEAFPHVEFFVVANGSSNIEVPNVQVINTQETQIGPVQTSINIAESLGMTSKSFRAYIATNADIVKLSDDRIFNRNIQKSQHFYSGLFADPKLSGSLKNRLEQLVNGLTSMNDVMKNGEIAFGVILGVARERAKNNSMIIEFKQNGKTKRGRITNAPESINITHQELYNLTDELADERPDYTITTALRFQNEKVTLQYSFRSQNDDADAQNLAQNLGGDGSKKAAGATIPFTIPLNFEHYQFLSSQ